MTETSRTDPSSASTPDAARSRSETPVPAYDPFDTVPKPLRVLFTPKNKPPSRINRTVNRAFVRANVAVFRGSKGRVGGRFMGMDLLLLTTIGRKTGAERTNSLNYFWDRGRFVVCAAYGGEIVHPAWYLNLQAVPRATVELGPETLEVVAHTEPAGPERERLWQELVSRAGNYARFQTMTSRLLPIVVLTPVDILGHTPAGGGPDPAA